MGVRDKLTQLTWLTRIQRVASHKGFKVAFVEVQLPKLHLQHHIQELEDWIFAKVYVYHQILANMWSLLPPIALQAVNFMILTANMLMYHLERTFTKENSAMILALGGGPSL